MRKNSIADNGNVTFGLVILIIGTVWLLKTMGVLIPGWVLSWPMVLIAVGVVVMVKHNFQSVGGAVLLLIGSYFLLKREYLLPIEFEQYLLPVGLILLGIVIMFRKRRRSYFLDDFGDWEYKKKAVTDEPNPQKGSSWTERFAQGNVFSGIFNDKSDYIKLEAVFTSVQKRVLSKNFRGGKAFALFGGMEIDLSQADLGENPVLDVEISFSGLKLILPPHWDVQLDVTSMLAGVEDKRVYPQTTADASKVLIIRGTVVIGGLEIKSF